MQPIKKYDVLGLGAVTVDDFLRVDEFPRPDGKTRIRSWRRAGGGLAGTALVAAARLGVRAAYCGQLGEDELSKYTLSELEREGVDCTPVVYRAEARPIHSVIILTPQSSQRSILFSDEGVIEPESKHLDAQLIASTEVLFVDHTVPEAAIHAGRLACSMKIPVVADVESGSMLLMEDFLGVVDHLIVNQEIAQALTGYSSPAESAAALQRARGHAAVVVTAGEQGAWFCSAGEGVKHQPALKVEVVDTTGCGDVFHGAYAACLSWGGSIVEAVQVATIAAGLKATQPGGRQGIPNRETVASLLADLDKP